MCLLYREGGPSSLNIQVTMMSSITISNNKSYSQSNTQNPRALEFQLRITFVKCHHNPTLIKKVASIAIFYHAGKYAFYFLVLKLVSHSSTYQDTCNLWVPLLGKHKAKYGDTMDTCWCPNQLCGSLPFILHKTFGTVSFWHGWLSPSSNSHSSTTVNNSEYLTACLCSVPLHLNKRLQNWDNYMHDQEQIKTVETAVGTKSNTQILRRTHSIMLRVDVLTLLNVNL